LLPEGKQPLETCKHLKEYIYIYIYIIDDKVFTADFLIGSDTVLPPISASAATQFWLPISKSAATRFWFFLKKIY
jgi:hypothetical protein